MREEQNQLGNYSTSETLYALIGCGSSKQKGRMPAGELYSSTYFEKKREFAEQLCDKWRIVSAKYGIVHPNTLILNYDASIDDVDINEWMDAVEEGFEELDWREGDEVWALIGQRYLDVGAEDGRSLRKLLNRSEPDIYYPFEQTSGIGEQNQWLSACVEEGEAVMPYSLDSQDQSSLSEF